MKPSQGTTPTKPAIIIHAGAGSGRYSDGDARYGELENALQAGASAMRRGSSVDGVVAAVEYMEESGAFNAGRGSCTTAAGTLELDAAVMWGKPPRGAGVGSVKCTYHPLALAKWVALNTPHVLEVGDACEQLARLVGVKVEAITPSKAALKRFEALRKEPGVRADNMRVVKSMQGGSTVGAAAVDRDGVPAAAVSTGGMWLKLPGRVGDSAIIGAGAYSDPRYGAASATGRGEEIIKASLCARACAFMQKSTAQRSAALAMALLTRRSGRGTGGMVTVDVKGRVGAALNTDAMGRAFFDPKTGTPVVLCGAAV